MTVEEVRLQILGVLAKHPAPEGLLGSKLGMMLKAPLGALGLKLGTFIQAHCADTVEIISEGSTVAYALLPGVDLDSLGVPAQGDALAQPGGDLFRIWRSPGVRSRLVVGLADGKVRSVESEDAPIGENERLLDPVSHAFLADIARQWAEANLPDEDKEAFLSKVDPAKPSWWKDWDELFKTRARGRRREWLQTRLRLLRDELLAELRAVGLDHDSALRARQLIETSVAVPRGGASAEAARSGAGSQGSSALRSALLAVIGQLGDHELRQVWVPAGLLFDALRR